MTTFPVLSTDRAHAHPAVRDIGGADLKAALGRGLDDFLAMLAFGNDGGR